MRSTLRMPLPLLVEPIKTELALVAYFKQHEQNTTLVFTSPIPVAVLHPEMGN